MTFPSVQLRRAARILNGGTPPSGSPELWDGDVPFATPPDLNGLDGAQIASTNRTITIDGLASSGLAPAGSVLLSTRAPIGHVGRVVSPVAFNQGCRALVPAPGHDSRFLAYALVAARAEMDARGLGTTFLELSGSSLAQVDIPLVPGGTQLAIADYLDRETAQIDAFIAKSEELIALLTERRAAAIGRAVILGLDPSRELLGIESGWLGYIPVGWRFASIKSVGKVTLGKMLQERPSTESDVSMPYLRAASVQPNGVLDLSTIKEMWFSPREQHALTLRRGDVVIVEGGVGGYGRAAFIAANLDRVGFQNSIVRVRPHLNTDGRYLTYVLLHLRSIGYIEMTASVASMPHFTAEKVAATRIPVPSLVEQAAIADHLDKLTWSIDRAIETVRRGVELARERRTALISAAVTGKIDVGVAV